MSSRVVVAPASDDPATRAATIGAAVRHGYRRFLIRPQDPLPAGEGLELWRDFGGWWNREGDPLEEAVPVRTVSTPDELDAALDGSTHGVALRWGADRVIPLESAIARRRGQGAIWVVARSPTEVPAALGALEQGADHAVVELRSLDGLRQLAAVAPAVEEIELDWQLAEVRRVEPVGLGDRVIVDTTSLLPADEGLIVGSAAGFLVHVASEAEGSAFSRPRPFRVNAGSAHSYLLLRDGTTRYLAELQAGDAVLGCRPGQPPRGLRVGRIKIERRPLLMVEVEHAGRPRTVFLQEAETVRLTGEDHTRVPVTSLAPGVRVWGAALPPGRHLGAAVDESVEEQ